MSMTIINVDFLAVLLFLFLDLILIIKPIPLLNGIMGLLSAGVALSTYPNLPLFPFLSLLMIALTLLVAYTGIDYYKNPQNYKRGKK